MVGPLGQVAWQCGSMAPTGKANTTVATERTADAAVEPDMLEWKSGRGRGKRIFSELMQRLERNDSICSRRETD